MPNIPSVDLNDFLSNDQNLKSEFVNKLGKAYKEIGFVALKGHFLKDSDIEMIYKSIKDFFDLPTEQKQNMNLRDLPVKEAILHLEKNMQREKKKVT